MTQRSKTACLALLLTAITLSPAAMAGGRVENVSGIPVLHLTGTPAEMGAQQGTLFKKRFGVLRREYLNKFIQGAGMRTALVLAGMAFQGFMPKAYIEEMQALAAEAGETYQTVVIANTFLDTLRVFRCSVFIAEGKAAREGRLLFARNNDFPSLGIAHKSTVLTVYHHAAPRHSFISVGWPGIIGVITGMNDLGLTVATLVSTSSAPMQPGLPSFMMYRRILEECATPDQALALVRATTRTSANNLAVAAPGAEPLIIEFDAKQVAARRPDRGILMATNHFRSPVHTARPLPHDSRWHTLTRLAGKLRGRADLRSLVDVLRAVQQRTLTIQSMIFEPETQRLHVAVGRIPAASGPYVTLDCKRLFAGK
ncbi:hypothetical protein HQ560_12220 [bacterium]|nr:hypothetical protein [bacterium]